MKIRRGEFLLSFLIAITCSTRLTPGITGAQSTLRMRDSLIARPVHPIVRCGMGKIDNFSKTSNPAINDARVRIGEGRHSSEPVVPVQDSQAEGVLLQDDGDGHHPCTCYVIAGTEKLCRSVRDICDSCMEATTMMFNNSGNDLLRAWVEGCKREPGGVPFPRELADRLEALTVEHLKPS